MKHYEHPLANTLFERVKAINFGSDREVVPIKSAADIEALKKEFLGFDYRAKTDSDDENISVFEGLAFDEKALRSQSFLVKESDKPIFVMTIVIAPRSWIEKQRYFVKDANGARLIDAKSLTGGDELPVFYVIPAWTQTAETHRNKLAMPGFRAFKKIIEQLQEAAPENTLMEMIAQGKLGFDKAVELKKIFDQVPTNQLIPTDELPFDKDLIGESSSGSSSTVKMAKLMSMEQIPNTGSALTLGPVFVKKLK